MKKGVVVQRARFLESNTTSLSVMACERNDNQLRDYLSLNMNSFIHIDTVEFVFL